MTNNDAIRRCHHILFRMDTDFMARLMGIPLGWLDSILESSADATDMDVMRCEMACCEQLKFAARRHGALLNFMRCERGNQD